MEAEPKGLASGELTGRAFRSPVRIDRPAGPHVDGLPSRDEVPPTDRFHVLPGRAGTPPDRTVAVRGFRGTPLPVCSIPRRRRRHRPPRKRGTLPGPPARLRADIDGSPAGPSRRRSGRHGLRQGGAAGGGRLGRTPSLDPGLPNTRRSPRWRRAFDSAPPPRADGAVITLPP